MKRIISFLKNLSISIISLLLFLIIAEAVSIFILPAPLEFKYPQTKHELDHDLWWKIIPNQNAFTHSAQVRINSLGLRNEEFPSEKPEDEYRILCLGDSITFGNGIENTKTYPKVLNKMLETNLSKKKFRVINAGVQGYNTWQEVEYLKKYGILLNPDILIIGFCWNDIAPKPRHMLQYKTNGEILNKKISKQLNRSSYFRIFYTLKRSRFLLFLRKEIKRIKLQINPSKAYLNKISLLKGEYSPYLEQGWKEVEKSLREINELKQKSNFEVFILIFPIGDQLIRSYPNASYQSRILELSRKLQFEAIDLLPRFQESYQGFSSLFIEWDGHPNENGHLIAANELHKKVKRTINIH